jgi:excisionase family DNA binding protein
MSSPDLLDEDYLSVAFIAAKLGFSERKVEDMCKRGEIKAAKLGRDWRIRKSALVAYLAEKFGDAE